MNALHRLLDPTPAVLRAAVLVWALLSIAMPAVAGGFSILPTRLNLAAERAVQSLMLTNTSAQTVTVESQVLVWPEGAPGQLASDVVVTPAVLTLPPGQRMRVRVGLLRGADGRSERAYRIYFTELPAPAPLQGAGVGVRLRIGVPLFVAPKTAQPKALVWRAEQDERGWQLSVHNPGNVHARVVNPSLVLAAAPAAPEPPPLPLASGTPYVLAGATLRIALPPGLAPGVLQGAAPNAARVRWLDGDDAYEATLPAAP